MGLSQKAWEDILDAPMTPERQAAADQFEKDIFKIDLPPRCVEGAGYKSGAVGVNVTSESLLTPEEADKVVEESRVDKPFLPKQEDK